MSIESIDVRLSRLKLMSIDDCDTDEVLDRIMDAVRTALTTRYPAVSTSVKWQTDRTDPERDLIEVGWDAEDGEDARLDAEMEIVRLVDVTEADTISSLFDVEPAPWKVWRPAR